MEILSPVWPTTSATQHAPTRPHALAGARIALVDDNLDIPFTTRIEELLEERLHAKVRRLVKPSGTAPSPSTLIDEAARHDAAVVGIGL